MSRAYPNHTKLKKIFYEHYSPLCNFAAAILREKNLAEDVVQTVFIQLWENKKIFQIDNPQTYLFKCVKYKCIDYLRAPRKKKEVFIEQLPEYEDTIASSIGEEDILPMLHYFASQLPSRMQQVFLLSRKDGMSYKEIASELNISVKTVENQMGSALKKLRILLKKHQFLPALLLFIFFLTQIGVKGFLIVL